jgi:hypothetical protein
MIYKDYKRNHAVLPGREAALEAFLKQDYKGMRHKWNNGFNSNSEDALTWSCFDLLSNFPLAKKLTALNEIFEDAYQGQCKFSFSSRSFKDDQIQIYIGKQYTGSTSKESTEVDASIELPDKLIFFEAKLYSSMSMASPPEKPHDQIARKLRIGLDSPLRDSREFFFVFVDIAPLEKLTMRKSKAEALSPSKNGFADKWKSAWLFNYYKFGRNNSLTPLRKALEGINTPPLKTIAENMGWLTWSDLFKIVLRGMIQK